MIEAKRVLLKFLTDDPQQKDLVADYWHGYDHSGTWKWTDTVQNIASKYGVAEHQVASAVRPLARAFDLSIVCSVCGMPRELNSRTDLTSTWNYYGEFTCQKCRAAQQMAEFELKQKKEAAIAARKAMILAQISSQECIANYSSLDYREAVLMYSIMLASDEACETGVFREAYRLNLASSDDLSRRMLASLKKQGLLALDSHTSPSLLTLQDQETLSFDPLKVTWRLARDADGRTFPAAFKELGTTVDLRQEHPSYEQTVADLWWELALDDAKKYLADEVATYRISDYRFGPKSEEAIRHALERYSIPQVRRHIKKVVEKASALSNRHDFNRRHALNTIPGNLRLATSFGPLAEVNFGPPVEA
jgi:hypothetical protein